MADTTLHLIRFAFWASVFAFPVCLLLAAVAFRSIEMVEGEGPLVSRSLPSPTPKSAGHDAPLSSGGR